MANSYPRKILPRVAGVIFDAVMAYLISIIWSIIEIGLFSTHEALGLLIPGKTARELFVYFLIYLCFRGICTLFLGTTLGQYLSGLSAQGGSFITLRLLGPVRVMLDVIDPFDMTLFKERMTGTRLYLPSEKTMPLFSAIVIIFSLALLPASGFLRQTNLSTQIKLTERSFEKKKQPPHSGAWKSNTYKFYGEFLEESQETSKYLILPKYSLRSNAGKRQIIPEFYLYNTDTKAWVDVTTQGRWNWMEFISKVEAQVKESGLPQFEAMEDINGLVQLDNIQTNITAANAKTIQLKVTEALKQNKTQFLNWTHQRLISENFLSSFPVVFTEGELWHFGDESYFILSDKANTIVLSLNSLRPVIIRLHYSQNEKAKFFAEKILKDWLTQTTWVFDYARPFDIDTTSLDFFSALDYFPLTSLMVQNKSLYDFWGGQFGILKRRILASNDTLLKNLWFDSVESMLTVERAKKVINPDWVQMMEDFMSGFAGVGK